MREFLSGRNGPALPPGGGSIINDYLTPALFPWTAVSVIDREGVDPDRHTPQQFRELEPNRTALLSIDSGSARLVCCWSHARSECLFGGHNERMQVFIAESEIRFTDYPFVGASVYPHGTVAVGQIRDVDPAALPPEVRTVSGETLFVSAADRSALAELCSRNALPVRSRPDIWADLLEPFLDTALDADAERSTEDRLRSVGLSPTEIIEIRGRVERAMMSYNFDSMLWEWVHLGLYDLLSAAGGTRARRVARATLGDPAVLYEWAMRIADRSTERH
ncbi:hypothetical protein [Nocardia sp. NPDC051833]|uniref:hypothetical protein n=1 Tax=Nocardia sp. NPDC051833 TaxID=3155674 RepID=UPI003429BE84